MTSLTAIFGSSQEEPTGDTEKLLELYWNRAELKKEFANLREQTFQLKDQVKTEQGRTARMQQKYEHLENLLLDPEWVHNVVTFYQLRALNNICKEKLARFAESLKRQREQRQHSRMLEAWNDKRRGEAQSVETAIGELRMRVHMLEDQLQAERHRFSVMSGFVRFFRKRSVTRSLDKISSDIAAAGEQESQLQQELAAIQAREAPDTQGLSKGDKRSINLMILSYAQHIYLHYADDNLAYLLKESGEKSVGAINYGNKSDCDHLLTLLSERGASLVEAKNIAEVLQQRARLLSETAAFRSDDDAVPSAASVSMVYEIDPAGGVRKEEVNVLGENYWDIAKVVSR